MVQENLDKLFFVLEIGYLGAWGGGVNYLVYHAPPPIPRIQISKSRDSQGGREFSAISRPPPSLQFKIQNLGTEMSPVFPL